jgi:hypothetical protein
MTDHQNDELDALLRAAAQDYNRPGETPRDRMWAAIQAGRSPRLASRPAARRTWFIPLATAAVLVLGIAIGRVYERLTTRSATPTVAVRIDSTHQVAVVPTGPDSVEPNTVDATPPTGHTAAATSSARPAAPDSRPATRAPQPATSLTYRLAVVQHLASTEAMLTSFRAAAKNGDVDAQITKWARDLLTTTRLMQASTAAQQDPTMKRLLDDLELVLVQIAQYSSTGPHRAEELELIQHSIERRGVIGKLRTTIPARLAPSGT